MNAPSLKIDWATHEATTHAVLNWHYSRKMPKAKLVKVGAWEDGRFIGVVLFGSGAGNSTNGARYGLAATGDVAELVRVALRDHKTPVSRIVSLALKFLRRVNPGLKLVVSFADTAQGHHGGIYQAGNWIYCGVTEGDKEFHVKGEVLHPKAIYMRQWVQSEAWLREHIDPMARLVKTPGKHRYLMPLDEDTRARVLPLSRPYPKRVKQAMSGAQPEQRRGGTDPHAPVLEDAA
jgi:hypothetical protein